MPEVVEVLIEECRTL